MARDRPSPYGAGAFFYRSAGACPPRALDSSCASDGEGNPLGCACGIRGPSPYGAGGGVFYRSAGACPPRSPSSRCVSPSVVCDRLITNGSGSGDPDLQSGPDALASRPGGLSYQKGIETRMHNLQIVRYYAIIVASKNYLRGGYEKWQNPF